ncbi:MAG TPA: replicative DNA helicase [Candidatus Dormibacteraeota bacterium]|nr:replicative DNA helicase [Candidatus Dormibacteraeota bacterium]
MSVAPSSSSRLEGRVPPHDLEAESSVLGAILLDQSAIARVLDVLSPEDFYRENNGQIYRAALELFREGEPIDNVTVAAQLERMGVLERVGGRAQLALLQESVPTAANVEYYARIVKDKSYKRRLITVGGQVTALGFDEALDAEEAINQAQAQVYAVSDDRVGSGLERLYDLLKPAMDRIEAQMASGGGVIGIPSGFHDLDRMTNGFKPSDLIVIAGRPSMGKCLAAWTLVDDPRTGARMTIEEAVRRRLPEVMGLGPTGSIRPAGVAAWVDSGVKPCFCVRTRGGRRVDVTGHHPFLTRTGWRPLHEITPGEEVAVPRVVPCFGPEGGVSDRELEELARASARAGRLPARVWQLDRSRLGAFLAALLRRLARGAGSVLRLEAGSPRLAADLQHALARLGIVSARSGPEGVLEVADPVSLAAGAALVERGEGEASAAGATTRSPDLRWEEVVAVEPLGRHRVYDLTVPEGHCFVAQDVLVHNTSFVLNLTLHVAVEHKKPVAIFSLEMSKEQLVERMLCEQARIDAQRLHRGLLSDVEYERLAGALGPLGDAPIFIDDTPMLDDLTLRLKSRQARSREGIELIVIDYLQLMRGRNQGDDSNRVQEVSAISRSLKGIARELHIPVIAISQLSRAPEARPDKRPILSDLRESGCMPASTRLLRADTGQEITMGELVLSQEQPLVWSLSEDWQLVSRRLTRVFPSGIRPVFRLRLASGYEVEATANHPFRTLSGWTRLDRLTTADFVAVPRRLPAPERAQDRWDDDELILLAHLLGDGTMGPGIKYATADPANKLAVEAAAERRFGLRPKANRLANTWWLWFPSPHRPTPNRHHPMCDWLAQLGLWRVRAHDRFIPEAIHGLPDDQIALFLRHLWSTDGSITIRRNRNGRHVGVHYATSSRRLADGVRRLLLRLDIRSRLGRGRKGGHRDGWVVHVTGVEGIGRFLTLVGCHGARGDMIPECLSLLEGMRPHPNVDLVPRAVEAEIRAALAASGVTQRELATALGEVYRGSCLLGSPSRPRRLSWPHLVEMAGVLGSAPLLALATSDVLWDQVVEITPLGLKPTFDATVEGTHNFIANGVIAHNSIEQDADIVMFLYRDDYYNREKSEKPGVAEVIVAKHRNGPTGTVELMFRKELTRFENLERRRPEPNGSQ